MRKYVRLGSTALFLLTTSAAADVTKRDPEFEKKLDAQLGAIDAALVPKFDDATAKLDREDVDGAARGFEEVIAAAPTFSPAIRRLCYVEMRRGNTEAAIGRCREAVKVDANAENDAALALALVHSKPSDAQTREAVEWAHRAVQLGPRDEFAQAAVCETAMLV